MSFIRRLKYAAAAISAAVLVGASALSIPASAVPATKELSDDRVDYDKSGVLQVEVWYHPAGMEDICLQTGPAFLINRSTLLTCARVFDISQDTKNWIAQKYSKGDGEKHEYDDEFLHYEIAILGDNKKSAAIREKSNDNDYAVLSIDAELSTKTPLWLGDSGSARQTQDVFALGFPTAVEVSQQNTEYVPYAADDVTVTKGSVSKTGFVFDDGRKATANLIQHNAVVTAGNSGGPLVDADGAVLGVNASIGSLAGFSYAVEINKVKELLDLLNIEYNNPEWRPDWIEADAPDKSSGDGDGEEKPSVTAANDKTAADVTTKKASEDKKTDLTPIIIAGIAAATALIILLVVVMLVKSGRKPASLPAAPPPQQPQRYPGQQPPFQPPFQQPYQQQAQPGAAFQTQPPQRPDFGAGETAILQSPGSGETSLLSSNLTAGAGATMVRKRNGAAFSINAPDFVIGKERDKVDYCVNNNAVSRRHAKITLSGGNYFITDLNSSNYSYINGRRIPANAPQRLHNGDIVKLADEEFEFRG